MSSTLLQTYILRYDLPFPFWLQMVVLGASKGPAHIHIYPRSAICYLEILTKVGQCTLHPKKKHMCMY